MVGSSTGMTGGSSIEMSPVVVLLFLLALAFVLPRHISRRHGFRVARGPRKRHLVVRIVCGALAALILGAITVGTVRDVQRCYEQDEGAAALQVHVPSRPPAPINLTKDRAVDLPPSKLICHVIVGEGGPATLRPIAVDETVLDYVKGHRITAKGSIEIEGIHVQYALSVQELTTWQDPPTLAAAIDHSFEVRCPWGGLSTNGSDRRVSLGELRCHTDVARAGPFGKRPLSVVHTAQRRYHLLYGITRADADDPLKKVALTESVQDRQAAMAKAVEEEDAGTRYGRPLSRAIPMRGMALAEHIGVAALLLAVAWLLLVQLFRRRTVALVVAAVAMVLYVAALDRWALGTHLSHLADTSAPLRHRLTACDQATDTFFYGKTAVRGLTAVADDPAASPFLRDRARRTAEELENDMTGNMRM